MERKPARGRARGRARYVHPQPGKDEVVSQINSQTSPSKMEEVTQAMADSSIVRSNTNKDIFEENDNTRPTHISDKKGSSGKEIRLYTNYFALESKPTWKIYQYYCDFSPTVESSSMRRNFMKEHADKFNKCYIFDGMSDLKTTSELKEGMVLFSKRISDGVNIRISFKRVNILASTHPEVERLLNTQMKRNLHHLNFQRLGLNYFDPTLITEVRQYNLQVWPGVITSIRQHEERILMCVDTVHKIVRTETVFQIIKDIVDSNIGNFKDCCIKELVGLIVMTRYNNKTYRICDIDWSLNPTKTFNSRNGPITYTHYYRQQYNITVRDLRQPLLLCTSKEKEIKRGASVCKKIYLIPEFCVMTGITEAMRSNFSVMKQISNLTNLKPEERVENLQKFIDRIHSNPQIKVEMNTWGLQFSKNLVEIAGRVVPNENIITNNESQPYDSEMDFTRLIQSKHMFETVSLINWIVIFTSSDKENTFKLFSNLQSVANRMGMHIGKPILYEIQDDKVNAYLTAVTEIYKPNCTQMIMFILPNNKKQRYDALKKYTYIDMGVPSQCITSNTFKKNLRTVSTKIAIQLNCKLGGVPWALSIPIKTPLMICGYDTFHDSLKKGRSAGAFVASLNQQCTRWYSKVNFHSAGGWEELSNYFSFNFTCALKKYHQINKILPQLILIYRDGVGDGQIRYVRHFEIVQLTKAINTQLKNQNIKWAFIIVNKRINTRFYGIGNRNIISNPPSGTVVDTVVTRYNRYDFFLVSQLAKHGTISPTMYNVIEDNSGLKPEHVQRLTYKLTHLYFNVSGTISVPAPCQYAHKLAYLAGQSLHTTPKEELCDTLFYL